MAFIWHPFCFPMRSAISSPIKRENIIAVIWHELKQFQFLLIQQKLLIKGQFNAIRTSVLPWLDQQVWNFLTSLSSPHKYSYKSLHLPKTQIQIALRKHQAHLWLTISYLFSIKQIPVVPANLPLSIWMTRNWNFKGH